MSHYETPTYNGPFTLPFMRCNELMLHIEFTERKDTERKDTERKDI